MSDDGRATAQALADLRWLLQSPPLLDPAPGAYPAAVQAFSDADAARIAAWLAALEHEPAPLEAFLAQTGAAPRQRLGRRAERLLEFFLRHGPTHRLVACNIVLRDTAAAGGPRSVGEIDFLLEDAAGRRWHWELALKFFLCTATTGTAAAVDFVGFDRDDSLARKIDKMFAQQLRRSPPAPWNGHVWTPAAFTRGWLFYRFGEPAPATAGLHPRHARGTWLPRRELGRLPGGDWRWLARERWLSPARERPGVALAELTPAAGGVELARPALAVRLVQGAEAERVAVVPDTW